MQQNLFVYQWKILFSSKLKLAISILSSLAIPFFFSATTLSKAIWNIDVYMTIPVSVLFSELYFIEIFYNSHEIIYCTKCRKSRIFGTRCVLVYGMLCIMTFAVLGSYYLTNPNFVYDTNNNATFLLSGLYAYVCTSLFFGAVSCTVTNLTNNHFMGIGATLALFAVFYFVDFFRQNTIWSMFIFDQYTVWPYSKVLYLLLGIVLLFLNDVVINQSPYKVVQKK